MSRTPELDELHRLFAGMCDGTLDEAGLRRLERLLLENAEARRLWVAYCDLECGLARIGQEGPQAIPFVPEPIRRAEPLLPRSRWVAGLAASVAFILLPALILFSGGEAGAASAVRKALEAHSLSLDRCYRVQVSAEGERMSSPARESLLWTRGDRFWTMLQADGRKALWGRDEAGEIWFALPPNRGARLAPDEVPEGLRAASEIRNVELDSILREILAHHDLRHESSSSGKVLIHAEPRPDQPGLRFGAALLELDPRTHVILRLELKIMARGRDVARYVCTLVDSAIQDDRAYSPEWHLDPDAKILDKGSPRVERGRFLIEVMQLVRSRPQAEPDSPGK